MVVLPELKAKDCQPATLKYRAYVLNQRLLTSPLAIAQRVEIQLIKTMPWRYVNVDWE
jgi:hypothetical protein